MKKLICAMIALCLCLMCAAIGEAAAVTGDWYLNLVDANGMKFDPAAMGMDLKLTLNEDGSALMTSHGETAPVMSWSMEGEKVRVTEEGGDAIEGFMDGENFVIADEASNMNMIFGREKQAVSGYVAAAVVEAPAMADFEGRWKAVLIDMIGVQANVDEIGMEMIVEIADGKAKVSSNDGGEDITYEAGVQLEGDTLTIVATEDQMPMHLQLLQDGKMAFVESSEGMTISIYFEKIA